MNSYDEIKSLLKASRRLLAEADVSMDKARDTKQRYDVSGNIIVLHGDNEKDVKITAYEKDAFLTTVRQFTDEVTNLVEFNQLKVYKNSVEWSGKIINFDLEFVYIVGENDGVYINGELMKLDDEFYEFLGKLKNNYSTFNEKWGEVINVRNKKEQIYEK